MFLVIEWVLQIPLLGKLAENFNFVELAKASQLEIYLLSKYINISVHTLHKRIKGFRTKKTTRYVTLNSMFHANSVAIFSQIDCNFELKYVYIFQYMKYVTYIKYEICYIFQHVMVFKNFYF